MLSSFSCHDLSVATVFGDHTNTSENYRFVKRWKTGWPSMTNNLVTHPNEMVIVQSLRTMSYRKARMNPPDEIIRDEFDTAANSRLFVLYEYDEPVGTIRALIRYPSYNLPTAFSTRFAREILANIGQSPYVEITRLAIYHSGSTRAPRHALALMQNGTAEADTNGCDYILAPIRQEHLSFYSNIGFKMISEARLFAGWPGTATLACLDWSAERRRLRNHHRFNHLFSARNPE